jgi:hypothetical protein
MTKNSDVIAVFLASNNLTGTFPSIIQYLTALESLDVSSNKLNGSVLELPLGIVELRLHGNNFIGNILAPLCDLTALEYLDASDMNDICDPWCFNEGVLTVSSSIGYCANVVHQREILISFYNQTFQYVDREYSTRSPSIFPTTRSPTIDSTSENAQYCDFFIAKNTAGATKNTIVCSIEVCPGETLVASTCDGAPSDPFYSSYYYQYYYDHYYYFDVNAPCTADTVFRLKIENKEVASNDDACGLCSAITYALPSTDTECEVLDLHQGCYRSSTCSGRTKVTGGVVVDLITNSPTVEPTTMAPTQQVLWTENWLSNLPYKDWYGITTYKADVVGLVLPSVGLLGRLPSSLSGLSKLQKLNLQNNSFTGTVKIRTLTSDSYQLYFRKCAVICWDIDQFAILRSERKLLRRWFIYNEQSI